MDCTESCNRSGVIIDTEAFLADIGYRRYSVRTVALYRQALTDFDRFLAGQGIKSVQEVTTAVLESYQRHLQERKFSPAGEDTYIRAVKRFFGDLEGRQQLFENPFAGLGMSRVRRKCLPVPTEEEMRVLLAVPDTTTARGIRTRALLEVAYSTGARLEELARMKHGDLDLVNGTIRILGKGNRERVVPLGKSALDWIGKYTVCVRAQLVKCAPGPLWVGPYGRPVGSLAIGLSVRECARTAGTVTPITPHGIRRACATHMLNHGAHPVQIQMLLGHACMKHLSQYLQVQFREMKAAHERSRLGQ